MQNTRLRGKNQAIFNAQNKAQVSIISAYFNAAAFEFLAKFSDKIAHFELIVGKDAPSESQNELLFYLKNDEIEIKDYETQLNAYATARTAANFIREFGKVFKLKDTQNQILLHSKLYLLRAQNYAPHYAIVGSSNFTVSGLGLYESANLELNLLCKNSDDISDCTDFFERLKSEKCEDATDEVIANIDTEAFYRAPSEIIIKIYQDYNKDFENVKEPEKISKAGELFRLFDFQKQAASELYKRLESYGVAMLADPVGAGKTLSALAVSSGYKRVAIIVPKRLKAQWESYFVGANLNEFEREFLQNLIGKTLILSYHEAQNPSDLQRQFLGFAELIIIDESHNFRNGGNFKSTLQSSKNSEKSQNRYDKMRQNLNPEAKLLLLSATPINNYYEDLAHQIGLLQNKILMGGEFIDISQSCKKATRLSKKGELLNKDYMTLTHSIVARSAEKIAKFLKDLGKDMPKPNIAQFALSSVPSEFEFDFDALCKILGLNDESAAKMSSKKAFDKPSDWAFERASKRQKDIIKFCIYDPFDYLPKNLQEALQDKRLANLQGYDTPVGFICMKLIKALESSVEAFLGILSTIKSYYENALKIHEKKRHKRRFCGH